MTSEKKNNILNSMYVSVIIFLLGIIGFFNREQYLETKEMAKDFKVLQINNSVEHNDFRRSLDNHLKWTHEVYETKILPNEKRSRDNEKEIIKLKSNGNI